ncbi:MAG: M28 family peptidase [Gemmataceae bacterium]|nr:M28 family peptidase [Gemmataceae bacterium]
MTQTTGWIIGAAVLATGAGASFWWLHHPAGPNPDAPPKFAEDTVKAPGVKFDGDRALRYLKQLCDIGPRVSGSEGMRRQQEVLEKHFKDLGATVTRQEFKARQRSQTADTPMTNLIISWNPEKARRVIFCAHYDTRPIADQEPNPANWTRPFVSANDGAAGAAWMMELGHHMKDLKTEVGVDFVLFDGEEYVFKTRQNGGDDKYFFGSEYFAEDYKKTRETRKHRYEAAVLMDLCHAKGASLRVEGHSWQFAKPLVDAVWGTANAVKAKSFRYEEGHTVQDDHLALNEVGIPAVDLIDFDYPHWHKLTDTPDKVSAEQMAEVALVLTTWVASIT